MTEPQPKCLRIVVTAFFADGSSSVIDIPEPEEVKDESRVIYPEGTPVDRYPLGVTASYEFVLTAKVNKEIPMRLLTMPLPSVTEDRDMNAVREHLRKGK